jgi:hypothetical protein
LVLYASVALGLMVSPVPMMVVVVTLTALVTATFVVLLAGSTAVTASGVADHKMMAVLRN